MIPSTNLKCKIVRDNYIAEPFDIYFICYNCSVFYSSEINGDTGFRLQERHKQINNTLVKTCMNFS